MAQATSVKIPYEYINRLFPDGPNSKLSTFGNTRLDSILKVIEKFGHINRAERAGHTYEEPIFIFDYWSHKYRKLGFNRLRIYKRVHRVRLYKNSAVRKVKVIKLDEYEFSHTFIRLPVDEEIQNLIPHTAIIRYMPGSEEIVKKD